LLIISNKSSCKQANNGDNNSGRRRLAAFCFNIFT
jgi:hypothetical protein